MTDSVDHVLDAIDNALAWDGFSDAMTVRYGDDGAGAPGLLAEAPEHHVAPEYEEIWSAYSSAPIRSIRTMSCECGYCGGSRVEISADGITIYRADGSMVILPIREVEGVPAGEAFVIGGTLADEADLINSRLAAGDPAWWVPAPREDPYAGAQLPGWPEGWRNVGYITDVPEAFHRQPDPDDDQEVRYHERFTMMNRSWAELAPMQPTLSPEILASLGLAAQNSSRGLSVMAEAMRGPIEVIVDAAVQQVRTAMSRTLEYPIASAVNPEVMKLVFGPQGILPQDAGQELTPRDRSLAARRNRNTGPARNPHRHRGV